GHVRRRVHRQPLLGRDERLVVHGLAAVVEAVPERDGHAEEALAADEPVGVESLHPALVARLHEGRVPGQLLAQSQQLLAMLEPFSGSASSWATTGTSTPNSGVRTVVPKRSR